jgi:chromosomal replication initiator protein
VEFERGVTAAEIWEHGATALRSQLAPNTWGLWFQGVRAVGLTDDVLTLAVPSSLAADRIRSSYTGMLADTLRDVTGQQLRVELTVETDTRSEETVPSPPPPAAAPLTDLPGPTTDDEPSRLWATGGLNPRYTFDQFVIGASNRFAHAAALSVAEAPARSYNPLFIYGAAGLGKTHLLHAIGNYICQNYPDRRTRYLSTETFTNDFIDAIRTNTAPAFKRRYRDCDVLLIDDIQFLEHKEGTQEEFFHTFNSLHEASRQIVMTSDRPPKSIATLEDRLRSRFEWGLITDVQPPDVETRLAILRHKAGPDRPILPNEVLEFIATHITDNIRELEGALIRVTAFASLNHEPVTQALAERVLAEVLSPTGPAPVTPQVILDATATTFGFSLEELRGKSRRRPLVTARQVGMYVCRELTDYSYPAIGRQFGNRDHTTVMHAVEKVSTLMKERRVIYDQVTELIRKLKSGG